MSVVGSSTCFTEFGEHLLLLMSMCWTNEREGRCFHHPSDGLSLSDLSQRGRSSRTFLSSAALAIRVRSVDSGRFERRYLSSIRDCRSVVGALIVYSAAARSAQSCLDGGRRRGVRSWVTYFLRACETDKRMTAIAVGDGVFAILYVAYLVDDSALCVTKGT